MKLIIREAVNTIAEYLIGIHQLKKGETSKWQIFQKLT